MLGAFEKTKELKPGETETLVLTIPTASMASYDDLGKVQKSAYVLEKGDYHFYLGNSVRDAGLLDFVWTLDENQVTLQLMEKMAPSQLPKRLLADGSFEELPQRTPNDFMENGLGWPDHNPEGDAPAVRARTRYKLWSETPEKKIMLIDVAEGRASLDEFMAQLTDLELAELLGGQPNTGVANTFGFGNLPEYGVPNFMTADGPARPSYRSSVRRLHDRMALFHDAGLHLEPQSCGRGGSGSGQRGQGEQHFLLADPGCKYSQKPALRP